MTDAPDPDQLARHYLDLWQQQVTAWLNEPDVADAMAQTYLLMVRGLTSLAKAAAAKTTAGKSAAPGPAAAAAPSGGTDRNTLVLAYRIAQLEERIARLESAAAAVRRPASQRTRQSRR
jgi:ubiquinone biosynthesis protein UbiJ